MLATTACEQLQLHKMFELGVPEKVIQERTGHRSLDSLRTYERTNDQQHKAVSRVLSSSSKLSYCAQTQRIPSTLNAQGCSFTFGDLQNCTINIQATPLPVPIQPVSSIESQMSAYEMQQFLSDM